MFQGGNGELSSRKLHPFFNKADPPAPEYLPITPSTTSPSVTAGPENPVPESQNEEPQGKRRKADIPLAEDESEPKKQRRKRRTTRNSLTGAILNHLTKPQQHSSACEGTDRIKKIPSPPFSEVFPGLDAEGEAKGTLALDTSHEDASRPPVTTQPKRVLRFNSKTGTLGSPPKSKRPSKPSRIVCIRYGRDSEDRKRIGNRISHILEGNTLNPAEQPSQTKAKALTKTDKTKNAHPFFSKLKSEASKAAHPAVKPSVDKQSVFSSTPVSPRKPRNVFAQGKAFQFGKRFPGAKVPGAMYPLWPPQGMSHVRGEQDLDFKPANYHSSLGRKSKGSITNIAPHESLVNRFVDTLNLPWMRKSFARDTNYFAPAPAELRLPTRHFESGRKLKRRIRSQVQARFIDKPLYEDCDFSPDELAGPQASSVHPALQGLYKSLDTRLSAYDRSSCESLAWAQKYAPITATQVLQSGREALLLRDWLQTLRVQSVESGSSNDDKDKGKSEGGAKKKRKKNKLEGFVIESEDETDTMYEISDDDNDCYLERSPGFVKKTVVRNGGAKKGPKDQGRLVNAVILSGPHGCGKTAAVYAVARELDFEIFEINSSSRRSGKDILERVGDMTRNHLVQHNRIESTIDEGDETANDIKPGKQGMMTAFFKPKQAATGPKQGDSGSKGQEPQVIASAETGHKSGSGKAQRQSLILVEEVDILFEEDKQFWATLMGLIAQSKRPFIMTCNDESLVPIQSLSLHGILRFSAVPSSLAVDSCLLIAANEGHALQRCAVEALYRSRNEDLRATITELNYWCQLGVGDRRGGFDWFYLRWPKGCDLDENGGVVRVVSEDTYQKGMGWVGRDEIATTPDKLRAEEEAMRQSWDSWQCDIGDWCETIDVDSWAMHNGKMQHGGKNLTMLTAYDAFCSTMSDADLCSSGAYGTKLQEVIDATLPDMPTNARDDFIIGQILLGANPVRRQVSTDMAMSISLKSLAREALHSYTGDDAESHKDNCFLEPLNEERVTSILDRQFLRNDFQMVRYDLAVAFDPIAVAPKAAPTTHLDPSVFDRALTLIVLDVAPWVRGIMAHEHQLMQRQVKLSNLLSQGGGGSKRKRTHHQRNTRSALSAAEGGERASTRVRRDKYFGDCLLMSHVMRTGGEGWGGLVVLGEGAQTDAEAEDDGTCSPAAVSDELSK